MLQFGWIRVTYVETNSDLLRWSIGKVSISAIPEIDVHLGASFFFPGVTDPEVSSIDWLHPRFVSPQGEIMMRMQAFIVRTPTQLIVVDTCFGNDKKRLGGSNMLKTPFLERFKASGCDPGEVDVVLCTHLHVDHVGWNTRLEEGRWVPTFPNARYLIARIEHENWRAEPGSSEADLFADSIQPIFDAGLVDLVETDHQVCPEVNLVPTPGHTRGHVSVQIGSDGESALITGDFVHHPLQIARPDLASFIDEDPATGAETRRRWWSSLSTGETLLIGSHFMPPVAGKVRPDRDTFKLSD